jgi:hypothetical protein
MLKVGQEEYADQGAGQSVFPANIVPKLKCSHRAVGLPDAADRLWVAMTALYPGPVVTQSLAEAIKPSATRLSAEFFVRQALIIVSVIGALIALGAAVAGFHSLAIYVSSVPIAAFAVYLFFRQRPDTHPFTKIIDLIVPRPDDCSLLDGVVAMFRDGELLVYPMSSTGFLTDQAAVPPGRFAHRYACGLLDQKQSIQILTSDRIALGNFSDLAVSETDLGALLQRLRPLNSYTDLIGTPDWVVRRAETATLSAVEPKLWPEITRFFTILRTLSRHQFAHSLDKQRIAALEAEFAKIPLTRDVHRSTIYAIEGGKHPTGRLVRFR